MEMIIIYISGELITKEIDYIEEKNGMLYGYEIKLGSGKSSGAKLFLDTYVNSEFKIIKKDNYNEFIF